MKYLICIIGILLIRNCQEDNDSPFHTVEQCQEVDCGAIYQFLNITVLDQYNTPIALDSFFTKTIAGESIVSEQEARNQTATDTSMGKYLLVSNSSIDKISFEKTELQFLGYLDGEEILNEKYVVSRDCCSISLLEGPLIVRLPN